jgi:hypothetical protein
MKKVTQKSLSKQEDPVDKLDYSKNELDFKLDHIEGTPFTAKWEKDKGTTIGIGTYALTKPLKTQKEVDDWLNEVTLGKVTQLIITIIDMNNKNKIQITE